jgi:hypothetical protein
LEGAEAGCVIQTLKSKFGSYSGTLSFVREEYALLSSARWEELCTSFDVFQESTLQEAFFEGSGGKLQIKELLCEKWDALLSTFVTNLKEIADRSGGKLTSAESERWFQRKWGCPLLGGNVMRPITMGLMERLSLVEPPRPDFLPKLNPKKNGSVKVIEVITGDLRGNLGAKTAFKWIQQQLEGGDVPLLWIEQVACKFHVLRRRLATRDRRQLYPGAHVAVENLARASSNEEDETESSSEEDETESSDEGDHRDSSSEKDQTEHVEA